MKRLIAILLFVFVIFISRISICATSGTCSAPEPESDISEDLFITEGGWKTYLKDMVAQPGPCNIPIIPGEEMTNARFLKEFAYTSPFILRDASDNKVFRALCGKSLLLESYGKSKIRLSSANSYSYDKKDTTFKTYANHMMGPQKINTLANETFYFFGDNDVIEWQPLFENYVKPPLSLPMHSAAISFGLGGQGTGVPFHFHGPGFAETIYGRKRWFLTPPDVMPDFHPNKTTLQWFVEDYPKQKEKFNFHECTIRPGEIIYFPNKWYHATLNIDASVFVSTFLSP